MQKTTTPRPWLGHVRNAAVAAALCAAASAQAQFSMVPAPALPGPPRASETDIEKEYNIDAARHLYTAYPMRVYRGMMPPLLYGVMMVETEIDNAGQIVEINVVRRPAAPEVLPWVVAMIRRAAPFPAPARMANGVRYTEVWLVDKTGRFQVHTLTEGQR